MNRFVLVWAAVVCFLPYQAGAATFFSDDFESYAITPDVTAAGWTISNTAATVELEAEWLLLDTATVAGAFGLPAGVHFGPATADGATTPPLELLPPATPPTIPGGLFIGSLSDGIPLAVPTHPGSPILESPIHNGTYTGASNDIVTPGFSTVGAGGDVWLHANVSANLNDGGQAIFDVDVSTDGGTTWINKFRRIAPGSGRNVASGDFDSDLDVDGADFLTQQRLFNNGDTASQQRFSDWDKAFQGVYTPVVATVAGANAGGVHGELAVNLGAIGGAADVKIRFRQFESRDDESIAIDNVVVNEMPPLGSASTPIFLEDFNSLSLGSMGAYVYQDQVAPALFLFDTGGGSGTISGTSWGAQDRPSPGRPNGRYQAGVAGSKNVNHLGHPTPKGASGEVPFAIIDSASEEDGVAPDNDNVQSERLHTPILDFSNYSTVILEWDDETIFDGNPSLGSVASVVLMLDDGDGIPNVADTVINSPNKFAGGNATFDPYLPYDQFAGGSFAGGDDPIFMRHRLDISADVAGLSGIYVAFQYVSSDTDYWAVDNVRLTGELLAASVAAVIPEPSSLLLALFGIPALATARRRGRNR